jgi:hypothetical protein
VEGIGHSFENFLQANHLVKKTLDIASHDMLLASGNGIWAMLE